MNKFDILLSLLTKVQEDYMGTKIDDMGGYGDRAYVELKLEDGSEVKLEVMYKEPQKEPSDVQD